MSDDNSVTNRKNSEFFSILNDYIQKMNEEEQKMNSQSNETYNRSNAKQLDLESNTSPQDNEMTDKNEENIDNDSDMVPPERETWGGGLEFLMSCIAMSVGLGNIWRFPFTAYQNGGGAFLIPYVIVLFVVGKPIYYLEMIIGQFSSKGSVKVYDYSPVMRGIGAGQTLGVVCVMTYYSSIMALIFFYLTQSFGSVLPWSVCDPSWADCYPSGDSGRGNNTGLRSSSELYFIRTVLREKDNINDGIGAPGWELSLCLLVSWVSIWAVLLQGIKSSGKAAYFLALFPYVVMFILFIRAVTLKGAVDGIIFFIKPDFKRLLEPGVWHAAVTQCFFSLSVCFGNLIMYASYNKFRSNIHRDTLIVTTIDTLTSLLAGFTIFGILGNLALTTGTEVSKVVKGGPMLAFVSYPEALSKFTWAPQFFSVLFFLMLFVLGIGSNIAQASCIVTVIRDKFVRVKNWQAASAISIFGFTVSLVYITPGGQFILTLVDHHGASFIIFILGIAELFGIFWIYGLRNVAEDVEFMLNRGVSWYFRICWSFGTILFLIFIMIYSLINLKPIKYNGVDFPTSALVCGWILSIFGIIQLPLLAGVAIWHRRDLGDFSTIMKDAFSPKPSWGPLDPRLKKEWIIFKKQKAKAREEALDTRSRWKKFFDNLLGY